MKKWLSCFCVTMLVLLSACGKESNQPTTEVRSTSESTVVQEAVPDIDDITHQKREIDISVDVTPVEINVKEMELEDDTAGQLDCIINNWNFVDSGYMFRNQSNVISFTFTPNISGEGDIIIYDGDKDFHRFDLKSYEAGKTYTASEVLVKPEEYREIHAYVDIDGVKSNSFTIYTYDKLSGENKNEAIDYINTFEEAVEVYEVDGYIPEGSVDDALKTVEGAANDLMNQEKVLVVRNNRCSVYVKFSNGIEYLYQPTIKGRTEGDGEINVATVEPYDSLEDPDEDGSKYNTMVDGLGSLIEETFDTAKFTYDRNNEEVSLGFISQLLGDNQVILWYGHGGWDEEIGSSLMTGDFLSATDLSQGNIGKGILYISDDRIGITKDYIHNTFNSNSFANSMVFLHSCYSSKKDLDIEFLRKGASVVVGFSDSVITAYGNDIMEYTIKKMCTINEATGDFYTIREALSYAEGYCGVNDAEYGGTGTYPILIGNGDYTFKNAIESVEEIPIPDGEYIAALGPKELTDTFEFYDETLGNIYSAKIDTNANMFLANAGFVNIQTGEIIPYGEYELPCSTKFIVQAYGGEDDANGNPIYYEENIETFNGFFTTENNDSAQNPMANISGFGFRMTIQDGVVEKLFLFGS